VRLVSYMHTKYNHVKRTKQRKMENEDSKSIANGRVSRVEALSRQILDYLQKHPKAGDTLEGIATWWLEQQRIEQLVEDVAEALELLVKKSVIIAQKKPDGNTIYKIKKK
jgi:hypothetical protein